MTDGSFASFEFPRKEDLRGSGFSGMATSEVHAIITTTGNVRPFLFLRDEVVRQRIRIRPIYGKCFGARRIASRYATNR